MIWVGVFFVSILIHELGHAVFIRYFGWRPSIILYQFGGLATFNAAEDLGYDPDVVLGRENRWRVNPTWQQVLISFAGPLAGFILASLVLVFVYFAYGPIKFGFDLEKLHFWTLPAQLTNRNLEFFVSNMLYVNIFWGLMNLLPIYPLDGGQICKELIADRIGERAWIHVTRIGFITAGIMAVIGVAIWRDVFVLLLFGSLGYSNFMAYRQLQAYGAQGGFGNDDDDRGW
jgi:Zn-dependent protease